MSRSIHSGDYFSYWVFWSCEACGASDGIQGVTTTRDVSEYINHYCEVDDD